MGRLPDGIAALCETQAAIQRLTVGTAVHGDRPKALQALLKKMPAGQGQIRVWRIWRKWCGDTFTMILKLR